MQQGRIFCILLWAMALSGNPASQGYEHYVKIPLLSSQETSWPGPSVNDYKEEAINTSPSAADGKQENFDFSPTPFSIKKPEF